LIVLSLMILACGLGLYQGVTLRDDLVSHAVPIPVAADRSTATATRHEHEHSHFLIARILADGYDYGSGRTMLPPTLEEPTMPESVVHFQIRMPPHLHERLTSWAKDDNASLNALVVEILQKAFTDHVSHQETGEQVLAKLR